MQLASAKEFYYVHARVNDQGISNYVMLSLSTARDFYL